MRYGPIITDSPLVLSPMAGYTDHPFRLLCHEQGAALVCTELLSATAMWYGSARTDEMIDIGDDERPAGVQIFGSDPEQMAAATRRVAAKRPDFIDVNLGCSVPKVVKTGACSALARDPARLRAVLEAVLQSTSLPVSVKMRKGWSQGEVSAPWIAGLCEELGVAAVTIHGRTSDQGFDGAADWDIVRHIKQSVSIPVLGSGDLRKPQDVARRMEETGCDGVMIGRAAMGDPWFFSRTNHYLRTGEVLPPPAPRERLAVMRRHLLMNVRQKGERHGVVSLRCQIAAYCRGLEGGGALRDSLMRARSLQECLALLDGFAERLPGA